VTLTCKSPMRLAFTRSPDSTATTPQVKKKKDLFTVMVPAKSATNGVSR